MTAWRGPARALAQTPRPKPLHALRSQNAVDPETSKRLQVINPCAGFVFQVGAAYREVVSHNRARGHRLLLGLERFGVFCSELEARHLSEEG